MIKLKKKTLEFTIERTIAAAPEAVFDAWLNPKTPGTTWAIADKVILDPKVDGLFYWRIDSTAHYGMFTEIKRGSRLRHTWMSPNTLGEESNVTVTFKRKGDETLMTLVHSGLPDNEEGRGHERGWNYFMGGFHDHFAKPGRKASKKK